MCSSLPREYIIIRTRLSNDCSFRMIRISHRGTICYNGEQVSRWMVAQMKKNGLTDPSQPESQTSDFGLESDNSIDSPETATSAPDPVTDAEADFVAPVVSSESPSDPEQPDPPKRPARKRTSSKRAVVHPVEQEPEVVLPPLETAPENESEAQPDVPEAEARPDVPEPETALLPDALEATGSALVLDSTLANTDNHVVPLERDWEPQVQDPDVEGIDAHEE
ncbi:MAG: hypothetical protein GX153_01050, partial [Clostridiaceae bacterium]|nr:hypothetical protein [Clostridiaceae bacterium]